MQPIEIAAYDDRWRTEFDELAGVLSASLRDAASRIEHVGSTSVPGLAAKPILDVDVVIADHARFPLVRTRLGELGYVHLGDLDVPGREAFGRSGAAVPKAEPPRHWMEHHLYVCVEGARELRRHIAFRDHLRANPSDADAYATLKRELARRFTDDREAYTDAKSEFVESILARIDV